MFDLGFRRFEVRLTQRTEAEAVSSAGNLKKMSLPSGEIFPTFFLN